MKFVNICLQKPPKKLAVFFYDKSFDNSCLKSIISEL